MTAPNKVKLGKKIQKKNTFWNSITPSSVTSELEQLLWIGLFIVENNKIFDVIILMFYGLDCLMITDRFMAVESCSQFECLTVGRWGGEQYSIYNHRESTLARSRTLLRCPFSCKWAGFYSCTARASLERWKQKMKPSECFCSRQILATICHYCHQLIVISLIWLNNERNEYSI